MLEVVEEEAHLGCQPVSPRLHETLMDLIDWREHGGAGGPAPGGKINLADTSLGAEPPTKEPCLSGEQSKLSGCFWRINMPRGGDCRRGTSLEPGGGIIWRQS